MDQRRRRRFDTPDPLEPINAQTGAARGAAAYGYTGISKNASGEIESAIDPVTGDRVNFPGGKSPEASGVAPTHARSSGEVGPNTASVALKAAPTAADRFNGPASGPVTSPRPLDALLPVNIAGTPANVGSAFREARRENARRIACEATRRPGAQPPANRRGGKDAPDHRRSAGYCCCRFDRRSICRSWICIIAQS